MRALIPLLLALGASAPARLPDTAATTLAADSAERWVPFTLTPGNQIRFAAMLDGQPVVAVLDTGASKSILSRAFADRAHRPVGARGQITAIGGAVPIGWTAIRTLDFGGVTRSGGGLNVVALPDNVTGSSAAVDLLVGRDLIASYALDIDYAARRFRLLPSGRMPFAGVSVPLTTGHAPLAYVTEVTIAGRKLKPIIVDTGDGTSLTLARSAWRTLPLAPVPVMTTQLAYGVGGAVEADVAVLPDIGLGSRTVRDVGVWIERTGGFSDRARSAGRIGLGLLQRYRVLLDPGAGHMVLGEANAAPPPRSTSGLQLALAGTRLDVIHVMRGSPAAATGWRAGDRICSVDGVTIASDPAAAARSAWPYGPPGSAVTLGMCEGEPRRLTLRRFY